MSRLPLLRSLPLLVAALPGPQPIQAQDLLTTRSTDHVTAPDTGLSGPALHDFDGDGLVDIVDSGLVLRNYGGVFAEVRERFTQHQFPLAFADFDGDGTQDILDYIPGTLDRVGVSFVRTPLTTQRAAFTFLRGSTFTRAAVGDFDGDGDPDILLEDNSGASPVVQVENLGGGRFQDVTAARMPTTTMRLGDAPMTPTDFDGDGDLDVIVYDAATFGLSVLTNLGGGVFAAADPRPFAGLPAARILGVTDADGDGDLDVWVDGARLLENLGGRFAAAAIQPLPVRNQASRVLSADLDNDGDLDAWLEAAGSVRCGWFENVGRGQPFLDRTGSSPLLRRNATSVAIRDLDGDGWLDVFAVAGRIQIHRGQPTGAFVDITREPRAASAYGDFDGDGLVDSLAVLEPFTLAVRLDDGAGGFHERLTGPATGVRTVLAQIDLDADGDLDLFYEPPSLSGAMQIALNDGSGRFTARPFPATLNSHRGHRFGDLDGDGDLDLLLSALDVSRQPKVALLRNDGAGNLTVDTAWTDPGVPTFATCFDLADADRDGDLDLIGCGRDEMRFWTNDGAGNFTEVPGAFPSRLPTTGLRPSLALVGDVDRDGDADVVTVYMEVGSNPRPTEHAAVFLNDGTGTYTLGQVVSQGPDWYRATFGDLDQDGDPDLLAGVDRDFATNTGYRIAVLENDGTGRFADTGYRVRDLWFLSETKLVDIDGDGDLDAVPAVGVGHALVNRTTDLRLRLVPQVGGFLELEVPQPDPARTQQALFVLSPSLLATPFAVPGLGVVTVDAAAGFVAFRSTRIGGAAAELVLPVPNDPRLVGLDLFAQAVVSPPINPRLTRAIRVPIAF